MRHIALMGALVLSAGAGTALAQDREKAPGDVQAIQTAYVRVYPLSNPPLRTVGFYLGMGKHIPLEAVDGGGCRGKLVYGGKEYPIAVEEAGTDAPELVFGADRLPAAALRFRRKGYLQAALPMTGTPAPYLRIVCVFGRPGSPPYALVSDDGAWKGSLTLGGKTLAVWVQDANTDGDLSNDPVMVDADGNGEIAKVERITPGETVLVGPSALRIAGDKSGGRFVAKLAPRASAPPGARDILAQLEVAPVAGQPVPAFEFTDQKGQRVSSAGLKGQVVLLVFWGAW